MAQNPLGINQGTNSYINFDQVGTVNTQVVNIGTINGNLPGGSIVMTSGTLAALPNLPQGSINVTAGTIGTLASLGTLPNLPGGSIAVTAGTIGTIQSVGTLPNIPGGSIVVTAGTIGTVSTIGTLPNLPQGSINVTAGTIGTVLSVGTLPNIPGGTINILAGGTLGILTNGTLSSSGTTTGVGTITNLGSVTNLGQVYNAGTIQAGSITITAGTILQKTKTGTAMLGSANAQVLLDTEGVNWVRFGLDGTNLLVAPQISPIAYDKFGNSIVVSFYNRNGSQLANGSAGFFDGGADYLIPAVGCGTVGVNVDTYTSGSAIGYLTANMGNPLFTNNNINTGTVTVVSNLTNGSVRMTVGTVSAGTINAGTINTGTITAGSIVVTAGTMVGNGGSMISYGPAAAAAASAGNPLNIGGTDSGGTIRTIKVDSGGLQRIGIDSGTISVLPNLPQGSINVTAGTMIMTTGTVNTGTINTGTINAGTFAMTAGTITGGTVNAQGTIKDLYAAIGTFTITVGTLASSSSGVGRQSTLLDNTTNLYQSAQIGVQLTAGTSTGTNNIWIYLIRSDNGGGPIIDDKAGASDAGWTQLNAPLLGIINVGAGTNVQYQNVFDTGAYRLGPKWGVGVVHNLGNPLNPTAGSHSITYQGIQGKIN